MFGKARETPQRETTPFYPRSPYARGQGLRPLDDGPVPRGLRPLRRATGSCSTTSRRGAARRSSPARSPAASAAILAGREEKLYLGNLDARRDWGYAPEYVEAMWLMLQQPEPDDYVIATGETHTVREFVETAFGLVGLDWQAHVRDRPALLPADRGGRALRRRLEGASESSAGGRRTRFRRAGPDHGRGATCARPGSIPSST